MRKQYLNEKSLNLFLETYYPTGVWIHNKQVPNSNTRFRPDYRNEYYKLIVEFDGYFHFNNPQTISNDCIKNDIFSKMNYTVISIPYFIQLDISGIKFLFGLTTKKSFNSYKHGFIDKKALLPGFFCSTGIKRFSNILSCLILKNQKIFVNIMESLFNKHYKENYLVSNIFYIDFIKTLCENEYLNNSLNDYILSNNKLPKGFKNKLFSSIGIK